MWHEQDFFRRKSWRHARKGGCYVDVEIIAIYLLYAELIGAEFYKQIIRKSHKSYTGQMRYPVLDSHTVS